MKKINLSPSFLITIFDKGYDYAVAQKLDMIPKLPTAAMQDGRTIHAMIAEALGGETFKVAISPYDSYRTKEAKDWRDSQPDDTVIMTEQKYELFSSLVKRLIEHPRLEKYLKDPCLTERVIEKNVNGFNVKGILDLVSMNEEAKTVIDWKFVSSQVFDSFGKKALYQHYDLQAAVYDFLEEPTNVYFCAIENEAPYRIKLFHCDSSFLESGADKFNQVFSILSKENWRDPTFDINDVEELISWNHYNG